MFATPTVQECRGAFPMRLARHYFLQLMQVLIGCLTARVWMS